jgi:hypothetical protein
MSQDSENDSAKDAQEDAAEAAAEKQQRGGEHPRLLPGARAWKIALRTVHLMAISVLVGGHGFAAPAAALAPWLYAAVASGVGMTVLEAYPSVEFVLEGWGLMLVAKLGLLCAIPFLWRLRFPLLLAVVAIAAVGSHMPRRLRHYSLLRGKVIE